MVCDVTRLSEVLCIGEWLLILGGTGFSVFVSFVVMIKRLSFNVCCFCYERYFDVTLLWIILYQEGAENNSACSTYQNLRK